MESGGNPMAITEEKGQWQGLFNGRPMAFYPNKPPNHLTISHFPIFCSWATPKETHTCQHRHLQSYHCETNHFNPTLLLQMDSFYFKDQNVRINNFGKHSPSLIISASMFTQIKYEFMSQSQQSVVRKSLISVLYLRKRHAHVFHYPRENPGTQSWAPPP